MNVKKTPINVFISKVNVQDKVIYTKVSWEQNENILFQIQIFDDYNNSSWSGGFSNELAEKCRKTFESEGIEEYKNNVWLALTGRNDSFVYDLVDYNSDPNIKIFKWMKVFDDSAIVVHGSVPVVQMRESKNIIIDFLLQENARLHKSIEDCMKENVKMNKVLETYTREFENFVNMKVSLEQTLYGKFVQLLNAKKRRIQLLEETLEKS